MPIAAVITPSGLRNGAVERAMSINAPSLLRRCVSTDLNAFPSKFILRNFLYSSCRSSGIIGRGLLRTSCAVQPNTCSAAGFHKRHVPLGSMIVIGKGDALISAWSLSLMLLNSSSISLRFLISLLACRYRMMLMSPIMTLPIMTMKPTFLNFIPEACWENRSSSCT